MEGTANMIKRECSKGHIWLSSTSDVKRNIGCPYCGGRRVCDDNSLAKNFKELSEEWNYEKNKLSPNEYVCFSGKRVWWKCKNGHEWECQIINRTKGHSGCPYCSGRIPTEDNNLAVLFPSLLEEWDYNKNISISPHQITSCTDKIVWWKCKKGHSWKTSVSHRTSDRHKCPYCMNKKASSDNCLSFLFPHLVCEFDDSNIFSPDSVVAFSNKSATWKCKNGHKWRAKIVNRTKGKSGCPYCCNLKASVDNCLLTKNPQLSKEWHPTKNVDLSPSDVLPNSKNKVWWLCPNGHEYQAKIYHRNTTSGCPFCSQGIVLKDGEFCYSVAEAYWYLKLKKEGKIFQHNRKYGVGMNNSTFDFYLPDSNTYIEVTSFHRGKVGSKYNLFYIRYLRKIVKKKQFVESVLGANFRFIQIKLTLQETKNIRDNASQFCVSRRIKTRRIFRECIKQNKNRYTELT